TIEPGKDANVVQLGAPPGKTFPHAKDDKEKLAEPKLHMAENKSFGVLFSVVLLVIILISNVPLRGLWSVVIILFIVMMVLILSLANWLDRLLDTLYLLDIRINMGGYFFISSVLFIIWALTVFVFDRRHCMVIVSGQIRFCLGIGAGETAYDTTGVVFMKRQDDLFRHWIVGLGSGVLIFKTSNNQEHDFSNVLFIGARIREIENLLKEKEVV